MREKIASLGALALVAPEAGETAGGTQIPELGALLLRHCDWVAIVLLRRDAICDSQQRPRNSCISALAQRPWVVSTHLVASSEYREFVIAALESRSAKFDEKLGRDAPQGLARAAAEEMTGEPCAMVERLRTDHREVKTSH
jgi:hypothetical protein